MAVRFAVLLVTIGVTQSLAGADEIHRVDGRTLYGEVTEYVNGVVRFSTARDDDSVVALNLIARIEFDRPAPPDDQTLTVPPPRPYEEGLKAIVRRTEERLATGRRDQAAVALYLDTDLGGGEVPEGVAEYRCFRGGGYSGIERAPIGAAWVRLETIGKGDDGVRRIEIDPGPPYAVVNRSVTLVPGEVASLGRVVLRRVKAERPVSVSGFVRDGDGSPVAGALVSAGARRTRTDGDGFYKLDGFGLEEVTLTARKRGYVGGGERVAIRDTDQAEIACDLAVFRPRRLKLSYAVAPEGSASFVGPGVETGVIERLVESPRVPLDETIHASEAFGAFAKRAHLYLSVRGGAVTIANSHAPVFYQLAEPGVGFDDVQEVGELPMHAQRCPPLTEDAVIVARGYRDRPEHGVAPYCVKFLVEELSTATAEFDEAQFDPLDGDPLDGGP